MRRCWRGGMRCSSRSTTGIWRGVGSGVTAAAYQAFLREIGYLTDAPGDVAVATDRVDDEIARIAGPQLVVPVNNARYALNAANARWGSLYDALYGTDAIADAGAAARGAGFNPARAEAVVARAKAFLDARFKLAHGSHAEATGYAVRDGALVVALAAGETGWPSRRNLSVIKARRRHRTWCCCATIICTPRSCSTVAAAPARRMRRG